MSPNKCPSGHHPQCVFKEAKALSSVGKRASLDGGGAFVLCTKWVKPTEKHYFLPLGRMGVGWGFLSLRFVQKRDSVPNKRKEKWHHWENVWLFCVCVF